MQTKAPTLISNWSKKCNARSARRCPAHLFRATNVGGSHLNIPPIARTYTHPRYVFRFGNSELNYLALSHITHSFTFDLTNSNREILKLSKKAINDQDADTNDQLKVKYLVAPGFFTHLALWARGQKILLVTASVLCCLSCPELDISICAWGRISDNAFSIPQNISLTSRSFRSMA